MPMSRFLAAAMLLLAICVPLRAATRVVIAEPLARVSLREAARSSAIAVPRAKGFEESRASSRIVVESRRGASRWRTNRAAATATATITGFASATSKAIIPGDAAGAVGLNHVVTSTNAGVTVHDRGSAQLLHVAQNQF